VHVRRLTLGVANGGLDLLALWIPDVTENDLRALPREGLRFRRSLSTGAATDERNFVVELSHGCR
jgi:hypothetical protein